MAIEKHIEFTNREQETIELLCLGCTNIEIAEKLNVSVHTAKAHVAAILHKLGVKNRLLAALKYSSIVSDDKAQ